MFKKFYLLMNGEGGDGGSNGGTNNSMLGGDPAASGNGASETPPANNSGEQPPNGSANPPPNNNNSSDWRSGLSKELQDNAALKKFTSIEALAGSYVNAQKMIGADKLVIPGKHATDEDWNNVYRKLGVPEKIEDYQIKFKDAATVDQKFSEDYRSAAHKLGILPKQAQALADWFSDLNAGAEQQFKEAADKSYQEGVTRLKTEWGNSFDLNIGRANKVLQLGGPDLSKALLSKGLGGDEHVVRLLAKVGETLYKEHKFVEDQGVGGNAMSPKELDAEIRKLQADPSYFDAKHPNHKNIVDEVKELYAKRYPVDKK